MDLKIGIYIYVLGIWVPHTKTKLCVYPTLSFLQYMIAFSPAGTKTAVDGSAPLHNT